MSNIGNGVEQGEEFAHPNYLKFLKNNRHSIVYPTNFIVKDYDLISYDMDPKNYKKISKEKEKEIFLIPPIVLDYKSLLNINYIESIDDLIEFVNKNIKDKKNFDTINRIVNCWIKKNFDNLKKYNKILIDIYYNLFSNYYEHLITENFKNICQKFIIVWFKKKKENEFKLNLGNDLIKYFNNKFSSSS